MDGATEFTNQGGKDPSFDQNKTLLDLHREGEVPSRGPISLSGGDILGDFVQIEFTNSNQNGESLQKSTDQVRTVLDSETTVSDQQCGDLRGILDLGAGAFPSFDGDLFGSPDRDLFLSNDGGERSRSYPPSPTAPSFMSKADEPSGLTVLSLEGAMGGLKKFQTTPQLPSSLLTGLESGKEFQTIRLQDPNAGIPQSQHEGRTCESRKVCDDLAGPSTSAATSLAEAVQIYVNDVIGHDKSLQHIATPSSSVTDLTMSPLLNLTHTMSTAVLNRPSSPLEENSDDDSPDHFPFIDPNNLASSPTRSSAPVYSETSGNNNPSSSLLLNVAHIEEGQTSQTEDGRLVYVITTKDQADGLLSKIQVTVDPNAIQSIPIDSLTAGNDEQWIMGEQILESGGGDADSNEIHASTISSQAALLIFPNQIISPVIDVGSSPPGKRAKTKVKRGKRGPTADTGPRNMWLKKNQPATVNKCAFPDCGMEFTSKSKFEAHSSRHAPDRPYWCTAPGCEWSFPSKTKLTRHLFSHEGIKPYICLQEGCNKQYGSSYNLKIHEKSHRQVVRLNCPVDACEEVFQSQKKLQIHLREHFAEIRLKCPVPGCEETFMTPNARGSHLRRHGQENKVFRCEYEGCNKEFDKESRLIYHTRSHTGERPYKCTYRDCQWAFTSLQKLKRHECRHTGRKDFCCPVVGCGKTFTRREHLQAHEPAHRGELPFVCKEPGCNARFSQRSSLHMHKKRHKSGKPGKVFLFSCALGDCNASFSTRIGLKNHVIKGHMDHLPGIEEPSMEVFDSPSPSTTESLSPATTPLPLPASVASPVMTNQPDTVSAAMTSAMLSTWKDTDETVQSAMSIQLPDVSQSSCPLGVSLGGDQGAISLLSSINSPISRVSYSASSPSKADFCGLGKKSPMFAMSTADSLVQGKDLDVMDSPPTSFALTSTSPLTLRDPATGAHFIQTQLLQDDPPDDPVMTFDLGPPASTPGPSPIHGVLPVSSILGDGDGCSVPTTSDFLSSEPGAFEESTINLQDLA